MKIYDGTMLHVALLFSMLSIALFTGFHLKLFLYPVLANKQLTLYKRCNCNSNQGTIYEIDYPVENMAIQLQTGDSLVQSGKKRTKRDTVDLGDLRLDVDEKQCVLENISTLERVSQRLSGDNENKPMYDKAAECMRDHIDNMESMEICFHELALSLVQQGAFRALNTLPMSITKILKHGRQHECQSGWGKILKITNIAFHRE